jgi:hypothetical protein
MPGCTHIELVLIGLPAQTVDQEAGREAKDRRDITANAYFSREKLSFEGVGCSSMSNTSSTRRMWFQSAIQPLKGTHWKLAPGERLLPFDVSPGSFATWMQGETATLNAIGLPRTSH